MINIIIGGCCCCRCHCHCNAVHCAVALHAHRLAMPCHPKKKRSRPRPTERSHAAIALLRFFNPALMIRSPPCLLPFAGPLTCARQTAVPKGQNQTKPRVRPSVLAAQRSLLRPLRRCCTPALSSPTPSLHTCSQLQLHHPRSSICRRYKASLLSGSGCCSPGALLFLGSGGMELGLSLGEAAAPDAAGRAAAPELGLGLGLGIGASAAGTGRGGEGGRGISRAAGTGTGWWAAPATPEPAVRLSLVSSSLGLQWPPSDAGESRVLVSSHSWFCLLGGAVTARPRRSSFFLQASVMQGVARRRRRAGST